MSESRLQRKLLKMMFILGKAYDTHYGIDDLGANLISGDAFRYSIESVLYTEYRYA